MKPKSIYGVIMVCLVALAWVLTSSGDMSSDSYIVPIQIIDSGGGQSTSTEFANTGAVGQTTPIGFSQSTSFRIRAGYIAQLASLRCWDRDGDHYYDCDCAPPPCDCDDTDFDINPGPQEGPPTDPTCTDGIDNDCDGLTDVEEDPDCLCWDDDGDGHSDCDCSHPPCDCDDADPYVHPDMTEDCYNEIDDDCNELVDWWDLAPCYNFILKLDADYESGELVLNYHIAVIEPLTTWANYLIVTSPTLQVFLLWSIDLPRIYPPVDIPISFPFPSLGLIGIYTGLFTAGGMEVFDLVWVDT